ncbi:hypothetical protein ACJMK2_015169, partial [Sinanodonta woodiana]
NENPNKFPDFDSIVICQDKIIVINGKDDELKIHRLDDGNFVDKVHKLDIVSRPRSICLMDAAKICVLYRDGLIKMASIKSEDMSSAFKIIKSFRLDSVFDECHSVVRVHDDVVVVGRKDNMMYWCIVSLDKSHVDTIQQICKFSEFSKSCVTTKGNIIYISCYAGLKSPSTGVYAFDISNPSECKYKYDHQRLNWPTSLVINDDQTIFVGNNGLHNESCIHQLTASCQLVAIFTQGIPNRLNSMFWDNGRVYVTCYGSHDITVLKHVYPGSHNNVLVSDERKQRN